MRTLEITNVWVYSGDNDLFYLIVLGSGPDTDIFKKLPQVILVFNQDWKLTNIKQMNI